jgi:aminomethyltransferase
VESQKKTPLHARHIALGARMVPFGGWEMPVEYAGIAAEHMAVRQAAGLFDVSHMGEIEIAGTDAVAALQQITSNDASGLDIGQAQYAALTTHEGTFVDDLLVYRLADTHFLLVVNAANIAKDYTWTKQEVAGLGDVVVVNASSRYALIALQGPRALEILQPLTGVELDTIHYYRFATGEVGNVRATISRTGYTGEDGFELFVPPQTAATVWDALLREGADLGIVPVGLGARDTLRLEAAMRLYGQDMDETSTVLEAGLGWIVAWDKPSFNGREALAAQKATGPTRRLVGFEVVGRGIARRGYQVFRAGHPDDSIGVVTSGTITPYLKRAVGLAYVAHDASHVDTELSIDVRGRRVPAKVVKLPFYKREQS